jgi:hypothetical protein
MEKTLPARGDIKNSLQPRVESKQQEENPLVQA